MNIESIEGLTTTQIQELDDDIIEYDNNYKKAHKAYWYVICENGNRAAVSPSEWEVLEPADIGWGCSSGSMRPNNLGATLQVCGGAGMEYWNDR